MGKLFQFVENGNGLSQTITPSSGTVSVNTSYMRGILTQVYAKATSTDTTFDIKLVDAKDRVVAHYQEEEGTLNDQRVGLPVQGKYTVTIENASADEAFDVMLVVEEI